MMSSSGGVWGSRRSARQPTHGATRPSYLMSAGISALALPFLALSRRQNAPADTVEVVEDPVEEKPALSRS